MKLKLLTPLLLVISYLLFVAPANAQTTNYPLNTNPDVPQNYHTYTQSVIIELASALSCQISGIDPIDPEAGCLGVDPATGKIGYVKGGGGLIGITGQSLAGMFYIPVSSGQYVSYLAGSFGISKNTYAQTNEGPEFIQGEDSGGVGFNGLSKLLPIWKVMRNVVYMLFVFVFVVIGVGIMFRIKIDPRTVMTIQNQIPKIIIALVLVTFSYAIAGLLIDLMYVFIYLIYNTIASANLIDVSGLSPAKIQGSNPVSAVGFLGGLGIAFKSSLGVGSIIASLFDGTTGKIIASIVMGIIGGLAGGLTGNPLGLAIGFIGGIAGGALFGNDILGVVGGVIAFLVISAALLTALFRLWFQLLKTYISILINIVLAPFWIAGGLIPTSPISFSGWMRDMIANLSAFPATLFMLLIGKVFIDEFGSGGSPGNFVPPFIGNPGNAKNFGALIGLGIILLTPNVVNLIRQAIKAPQSKVTAGIGQSLSIGASVAGAPIQGIGKKVWGMDPITRTPRPFYRAVTKGINRFATKGGALGKLWDKAVAKPFNFVSGIDQPRIDAYRKGEDLDKTATQKASEHSKATNINRMQAQGPGTQLGGNNGNPPETPPEGGLPPQPTPRNGGPNFGGENEEIEQTPEERERADQEAQRRDNLPQGSPQNKTNEQLIEVIRNLTAAIDRMGAERADEKRQSQAELNVLHAQARRRGIDLENES